MHVRASPSRARTCNRSRKGTGNKSFPEGMRVRATPLHVRARERFVRKVLHVRAQFPEGDAHVRVSPSLTFGVARTRILSGKKSRTNLVLTGRPLRCTYVQRRGRPICNQSGYKSSTHLCTYVQHRRCYKSKICTCTRSARTCNTFGAQSVTDLYEPIGHVLVTPSFRTNLAPSHKSPICADRFVSLTFGVARTRIPSGNGCTYVHHRRCCVCFAKYVHEKGTPRAQVSEGWIACARTRTGSVRVAHT